VLTRRAPRSGTFIEVYTTRPDTLYGATYMVLAPEHPLVDLVTVDGRRAPVLSYREDAARKDLVARQKVDKTKTASSRAGTAGNPATGKPIPIWIADYVLTGYGTGAIMAVPGHDERDYEFAVQFELPIVRVVAGPGDGPTRRSPRRTWAMAFMVNSGPFDGMPWPEAKARLTEWLVGQGLGSRRSTSHPRLVHLPGSGTGPPHSHRSTATRADRWAWPRRTFPSSCRASPTSSRTTPA